MSDQITRRRLLFLLPCAPRLDATHGGGRAIGQLLTRLAARHDLAVLYLRAADEPPIDERLRAGCALVEEVLLPAAGQSFAAYWRRHAQLVGPLLRGRPVWASDWAVPAFHDRVRVVSRAWQPEIVQIEFHIMGQYIAALDQCPAPRVLTQHEPGTQSAGNLLRSRRGLVRVLDGIDALAWPRFERTVMRDVETVVVFTERDRQGVAALAGATPIVRIPLGADLPEHALDPLGQAPNVLFVGNFAHPPNLDAAERLVQEIFPRVRERYHSATLTIVGDRPTARLRQLAQAHVQITGRVPDVRPYLERAAVVVAPLRIGGGMRVKVLEALAAGKSVVASPLAVEGLDLHAGEQIVFAETDRQFGEAIVALLSDPDRRARIARNARDWACAHLGWEGSVAAYEQLYRSLLDQMPRPARQHSEWHFGNATAREVAQLMSSDRSDHR
jgi:glycosyltransferase involved in cell wall biosynthesis